MKILSAVQETCFELLKLDSELLKPEHLELKKKVGEMFSEENLISLN